MMAKDFTRDEFACGDGCGEDGIQDWFIEVLQDIRDIYGAPMIVTSGFRCEDHNKAEGGKPTSEHLDGIAADIKVSNSRERFLLIKAAIEAGITRIGVGSGFVHLDVDEGKSQDVMWTY